MPAQNRDFIFEIGTDWARVLYLSPGPDADVRNFTADMQVRASPEAAGVPVLELSTTNGRIVMDYGQITLSVPDNVTPDTSTLTAKGLITEEAPGADAPFQAFGLLGVYDLFVTSPSGIRTRELTGRIVFVPQITR